ncbi:MAG: STAS/SEC14 domain-containing protein [Phycisphaerae bacterium]|nr:STAS/SEC14 domain-containing protein [Phycisphaerae bacterium]
MPVEFQADEKNIVKIKMSGKLTKEDYDTLVPESERAIERHGAIRVLFEMKDFHGWEWAAAWEDLKFDMRHHADIEKLAMVGENKWEKWMATLCKPFTKAQVRYFPAEEIDQAEEWVRSD